MYVVRDLFVACSFVPATRLFIMRQVTADDFEAVRPSVDYLQAKFGMPLWHLQTNIKHRLVYAYTQLLGDKTPHNTGRIVNTAGGFVEGDRADYSLAFTFCPAVATPFGFPAGKKDKTM
jgi:hypothetical protein